MSREARRMARERERRLVKRMRAATLEAMRAQGCTCRPVLRAKRRPSGLPYLQASHDDWCPLLRCVVERGGGFLDRAQVVVAWLPEEDVA